MPKVIKKRAHFTDAFGPKYRVECPECGNRYLVTKKERIKILLTGKATCPLGCLITREK